MRTRHGQATITRIAQTQRTSALIAVPFNQGSNQDVEGLYSESKISLEMPSTGLPKAGVNIFAL
jgi:3-oxoacyl-ACP reductase-like protein